MHLSYQNRSAQTDDPGISMPGLTPGTGPARAVWILGVFLALTLPMMLVQFLALRIWPAAARHIPVWYHRRVCNLLGIRHHITGRIASGHPVLIIANHVSWLDIPVLGAIAPLSFIAKREVGTWPLIAQLSRLQRTVFVDRTRRTAVGDVAKEMASRLSDGDALVLFAEGTSTDGNRVMPFKTALLAAPFAAASEGTRVQTLSLTYTHVHGVPIGRADRHSIGWYGDMDMGPHAWSLLKAGPLDVSISIGEPLELHTFADRKALARFSEQRVRSEVTKALRSLTNETSEI